MQMRYEPLALNGDELPQGQQRTTEDAAGGSTARAATCTCKCWLGEKGYSQVCHHTPQCLIPQKRSVLQTCQISKSKSSHGCIRMPGLAKTPSTEYYQGIAAVADLFRRNVPGQSIAACAVVDAAGQSTSRIFRCEA